MFLSPITGLGGPVQSPDAVLSLPEPLAALRAGLSGSCQGALGFLTYPRCAARMEFTLVMQMSIWPCLAWRAGWGPGPCMGRSRRQPGGSYITRVLRGPGGRWCYITQRVARGKVPSNTRVGDGQAGDPPDRELGHLEVGEWAVAQKNREREGNLGQFIHLLAHSFRKYLLYPYYVPGSGFSQVEFPQHFFVIGHVIPFSR